MFSLNHAWTAETNWKHVYTHRYRQAYLYMELYVSHKPYLSSFVNVMLWIELSFIATNLNRLVWRKSVFTSKNRLQSFIRHYQWWQRVERVVMFSKLEYLEILIFKFCSNMTKQIRYWFTSWQIEIILCFKILH